MEKTILNYLIFIDSILVVVLILLQNRGTGLGMAFGGSSEGYRTRRGAERFIFIATIVAIIVLVLATVARAIIV
ncbi:preprotein translocase subunit SecG [Candidatus Saccharibacteria bacterium]|nr:preprotein translocase subunit SecG [Candidatus Saccharibacteria bacterium]MCB9834940.1 preprotein translocase subunit SecG [Candidatus Nomurabacteria bacterium]